MTEDFSPPNGISGRQLHGPPADAQYISEIARHLTFALFRCVRKLQRDGLPAPREIDELALFVMKSASRRDEHHYPEVNLRAGQPGSLAGQLLVTKQEAAERLHVSVRTVERLVAAGRLRQIHVERLARIRVADLESFVADMGDEPGCGTAPAGPNEAMPAGEPAGSRSDADRYVRSALQSG